MRKMACVLLALLLCAPAASGCAEEEGGMEAIINFRKAPFGYEEMTAAVKRLNAETGVILRALTYRFYDAGSNVALELGRAEKTTGSMKAARDTFTVETEEKSGYRYLLYRPKHAEEGGEGWPLVIFLHGIGERGDDPYAIANEGLPKYLRAVDDFPMLVVAPQCARDSHWVEDREEAESMHEINRLQIFVNEIMAQYPVDARRVYLTGLSMGGRGTWKLACQMPGVFAAIAPICGRADAYDIAALQHVGIWMFHGLNDSTVPFDYAVHTAKRLLAAEHADWRFTVYPQAKHDAWTQAYQTPELYQFLLRHSLPEAETK